MACEEGRRLACSFPGQQRTDGIDKTSTGPDQFGADIEQALLDGDKPLQPFGGQAPSALWIAPPCATSGAWRVDEHDVGLAAPVRDLVQLLGRIEKTRFDSCFRPLRPRSELGEAGAVAVG